MVYTTHAYRELQKTEWRTICHNYMNIIEKHMKTSVHHIIIMASLLSIHTILLIATPLL